jgi:hypothetical protein
MNSTKPTTDAVVLDALRRTPVVEKAVAERAAAVVAERRALAARLAEVEDGAPAKHYLALVKQHEAAIEAARAAHKAYETAQHKVAVVHAERMTASFSIHGERNELIAKLHATAERAEIDAFISAMRDELQATRRMADSREVTVTNKLTGKRGLKTYNNGAALAGRLLAISDAIQAAEDMRLLPDQASVPARLAELRAALPPPPPPLTIEG